MKVTINYRDYTYGQASYAWSSVTGQLQEESLFEGFLEVIDEKDGKKVWVPIANVINICEK